MDKTKINSLNYSENSKDLLNRIVNIQLHLAEAEFNLTAFMQLIAEKLQELTGAAGAVVELAEGDDMVYRAATGTVAAHIGLRLNKQGSISGLCIARGEVLRSNDTEQDPRVNVAACRKVKARSLIVAPLFQGGNVVGVIKILSDQPNGFNAADVNTLQLMASFIAAGLNHQIIYEKNANLLHKRTDALSKLQKVNKDLAHIAHHDFLTKLPNRKLFNETLLAAMTKNNRDGALFALLYLDIDHFKEINDTLGHEMGDKLLQVFSERLTKCIRKCDTAARLGGDEFIIILESITKPEDVDNIANAIIRKINTPFKLNKTILKISCSIGVAFNSHEAITADELIHRADKALYLAKKAGRNRFELYKD